MAHVSTYIIRLTLLIPLEILVLLATPLHMETFCHGFSEVLLQAETLTYGSDKIWHWPVGPWLVQP